MMPQQHRMNETSGAGGGIPKPEWRCVCAGQGGMVYSAGCPIHDEGVDTENASWLKWYADHLANQQRIKERLGW